MLIKRGVRRCVVRVCSVQCAVSVVTCCLVAAFTVRPAQAEKHGTCWRHLKHEPWWFSVPSACPKLFAHAGQKVREIIFVFLYLQVRGNEMLPQ